MLVGYNHNIRHKGKLYHIQTEDSGLPAMCITTLLYSGGTIVTSKKSEYIDLKEKDNYEDDLRLLMQNQHKEVLIKLKDGFFDDPEQAAMQEPEEVTRKDELSILDAIKVIETSTLEEIIAKRKEAEKSGAAGSKKNNKEEESLDKVVLNFLSGELAAKKDEEKKE
jgi:hypothetical protein